MDKATQTLASNESKVASPRPYRPVEKVVRKVIKPRTGKHKQTNTEPQYFAFLREDEGRQRQLLYFQPGEASFFTPGAERTARKFTVPRPPVPWPPQPWVRPKVRGASAVKTPDGRLKIEIDDEYRRLRDSGKRPASDPAIEEACTRKHSRTKVPTGRIKEKGEAVSTKISNEPPRGVQDLGEAL